MLLLKTIVQRLKKQEKNYKIKKWLECLMSFRTLVFFSVGLMLTFNEVT